MEMRSAAPETGEASAQRMSTSARTSLIALVAGAALGTFIGALPGLGSSVAAFLSYGVAKRVSKSPERFGQGAHEGIAATESASMANRLSRQAVAA